MSLYAKTSSFEVYKFDNNFKLEGLLSVLKSRETKDIFGTNDLEYTSFEGHNQDFPKRFFHTEKVIGFNLNIQEKVFNKQTLKKKFQEAHAEYNNLKRLSASERNELLISVKTQLAPASLVKSIKTSFLMDVDKKILIVGISSRHLNALSFLERFLGIKRLRQRSLFSEHILSKTHSEQAFESFFNWFFQLATEKITNETPLFVKIDGEMKLKNKTDYLSLKGDNVCHYFENFGVEESKINHLKLSIASSLEPLAQVYNFRLSSRAGRISNFNDSHFRTSKDEMASVSFVLEKYRSITSFLNSFDVLINSFEDWFKKQDVINND